jgi:hypothetical protein
MNYLNSLYQQVLLFISVVLSDCEKQVKVGGPPKVSDLQIASLYVMSYTSCQLSRSEVCKDKVSKEFVVWGTCGQPLSYG